MVNSSWFKFHFSSDIALIKLPTPVEFSEFIQPIELSVAPINLGKDVISMGYGLVNLIVDGIPENMQYTNFKMTELRKCAPNAEKPFGRVGVICANVIQGRLCHGDMGAPLVSPDTGKLVGIAISSTSNNCEVSLVQSFIDISAHRIWIESTIFWQPRLS